MQNDTLKMSRKYTTIHSELEEANADEHADAGKHLGLSPGRQSSNAPLALRFP